MTQELLVRAAFGFVFWLAAVGLVCFLLLRAIDRMMGGDE